MLSALGNLYSDTQRPKEAEAAIGEGLAIGRELAHANPSSYADAFAKILLGTVIFASDQEADHRCSLIQEAVEVALSSELKQNAKTLQQAFCTPAR
jgi:hypothetical protein